MSDPDLTNYPPILPQSTLDALRREESDMFLSALFAPVGSRHAVMALYALDRELKRIPHLISEPMLGAIRFQWWRDTLGAVYQGQHPGHEIVPSLALAIEKGNLPPDAFHRWIDARENEMEAHPFATLDDMTGHARAADGTIAGLAARVLTGGETAGEELGSAYGLMDLLRRCGPAAARRTAFLPADMLGENDAVLFSGVFSPDIKSVFAAVAEHVRVCFRTAAAASPAGSAALPALLPAALVPLYLRAMRGRGFDPLRNPVEIAAFRRQLSLLARAMRGRI